mmetsp:Transcript_7773/g.25870  ORF Transcript_7773/g.25870 Transcript_7773/m.25870 type:complete len:231 (+) Transcript_7773:173-865(+)
MYLSVISITTSTNILRGGSGWLWALGSTICILHLLSPHFGPCVAAQRSAIHNLNLRSLVLNGEPDRTDLLARLGRVRVRDPLGSPVLIYYLYPNDLLFLSAEMSITLHTAHTLRSRNVHSTVVPGVIVLVSSAKPQAAYCTAPPRTRARFASATLELRSSTGGGWCPRGRGEQRLGERREEASRLRRDRPQGAALAELVHRHAKHGCEESRAVDASARHGADGGACPEGG